MRKRCLLGGILCMLACILSCSDQDDNSVSSDRMIRLYGYSYNLQSGAIWQSNPNVVVSNIQYVYEDSYEKDGVMVTDKVEGFRAGDDRIETGNFMLSLYENGLYCNEKLEKAQGKGACICFHLASPEIGELVPGKYVFGTDKQPYTFVGYCSSDYNTQNKDNIPATISEGEVTIEKNGEEYRVVFQVKTTFGGEVAGEYNGDLTRCRVSQISSSEYDNVSLAGLLDEVEVTPWYSVAFVQMLMDQFGRPLEYASDILGVEEGYNGYISPAEVTTTLDTEFGQSLFSLSSGLSFTADKARRNLEDMDLALVWDKEKESFRFESPIRMRSMLGHNAKYDFKSHTIYMKAPDSFTDADYENLTTESFLFQLNEEDVEIPTQDFKPCYVFFQTGKGVLGVIKVKSYTSLDSKLDLDPSFGGSMGNVLPQNPALQLEIKCPAVIANPEIR